MFGYRFIQYRLVFCTIPRSFLVCELIIYDITFVLLLVLAYIIKYIHSNAGITTRYKKYNISHNLSKRLGL